MKKFSTWVNKYGGNCLFWNPTVLVSKLTYLVRKKWKEWPKTFYASKFITFGEEVALHEILADMAELGIMRMPPC